VAWPKQETLGEELGVSSRTVREYLGELEAHALIESQQPGLQKSNRYRFLDHPWMTSDPDRQNSSGQDGNDTSDPDRQNSSTPLKSEENHLRESGEHPAHFVSRKGAVRRGSPPARNARDDPDIAEILQMLKEDDT
jgi:DNA-binding transcriptional MocR family regulator